MAPINYFLPKSPIVASGGRKGRRGTLFDTRAYLSHESSDRNDAGGAVATHSGTSLQIGRMARTGKRQEGPKLRSCFLRCFGACPRRRSRTGLGDTIRLTFPKVRQVNVPAPRKISF